MLWQHRANQSGADAASVKGSGRDAQDWPAARKVRGVYADIGSNEISLNERTVKAFEDGRGLVTASAGKVYLIGVVMLMNWFIGAMIEDGVD